MYKTRELKIIPRIFSKYEASLDIIYKFKDEITNISTLGVGTMEEMEQKKKVIEEYCYCGQGCKFCDFCTGLRTPKNNI